MVDVKKNNTVKGTRSLGGAIGIGSIAGLIILILIIVYIAVRYPPDAAITAALIGLIGTLGVAILSWGVFQPIRDRMDQEEQRKEREEQRQRLRKAIYAEMALVYSNLVAIANTIDSYLTSQEYRDMDEDAKKNVTFPVGYIDQTKAPTYVYQKIRDTDLLLFYELKDAAGIDVFFELIPTMQSEVARTAYDSGTPDRITVQSLYDLLTFYLQRMETWIYSGYIDCKLLVECGQMFEEIQRLKCPKCPD